MLKRTPFFLTFSLLTVVLLCAGLAAWPESSALADGGGFPTDTPRPTATITLTLAAGKGLSDTSGQLISTPTATPQTQSASGTPGSAPSVSSGQILPTIASGQTAPVSGGPTGETEQQASSSVPLLAIIGTAVLATVGLVIVVFILRRRQ